MTHTSDVNDQVAHFPSHVTTQRLQSLTTTLLPASKVPKMLTTRQEDLTTDHDLQDNSSKTDKLSASIAMNQTTRQTQTTSGTQKSVSYVSDKIQSQTIPDTTEKQTKTFFTTSTPSSHTEEEVVTSIEKNVDEFIGSPGQEFVATTGIWVTTEISSDGHRLPKIHLINSLEKSTTNVKERNEEYSEKETSSFSPKQTTASNPWITSQITEKEFFTEEEETKFSTQTTLTVTASSTPMTSRALKDSLRHQEEDEAQGSNGLSRQQQQANQESRQQSKERTEKTSQDVNFKEKRELEEKRHTTDIPRKINASTSTVTSSSHPASDDTLFSTQDTQQPKGGSKNTQSTNTTMSMVSVTTEEQTTIGESLIDLTTGGPKDDNRDEKHETDREESLSDSSSGQHRRQNEKRKEPGGKISTPPSHQSTTLPSMSSTRHDKTSKREVDDETKGTTSLSKTTFAGQNITSSHFPGDQEDQEGQEEESSSIRGDDKRMPSTTRDSMQLPSSFQSLPEVISIQTTNDTRITSQTPIMTKRSESTEQVTKTPPLITSSLVQRTMTSRTKGSSHENNHSILLRTDRTITEAITSTLKMTTMPVAKRESVSPLVVTKYDMTRLTTTTLQTKSTNHAVSSSTNPYLWHLKNKDVVDALLSMTLRDFAKLIVTADQQSGKNLTPPKMLPQKDMTTLSAEPNTEVTLSPEKRILNQFHYSSNDIKVHLTISEPDEKVEGKDNDSNDELLEELLQMLRETRQEESTGIKEVKGHKESDTWYSWLMSNQAISSRNTNHKLYSQWLKSIDSSLHHELWNPELKETTTVTSGQASSDAIKDTSVMSFTQNIREMQENSSHYGDRNQQETHSFIYLTATRENREEKSTDPKKRTVIINFYVK